MIFKIPVLVVVGAIILVSLALCMSIGDCGGEQTTAASAEPEQLPATVPVDTQLLMRIDPDQSQALIGQARDKFALGAGADSSQVDMADALVGGLMSLPAETGLMRMLVSSLESETDFAFENLAGDRPIVLAVTWPVDDEFLRGFTAGPPIGGQRANAEGSMLRIYAPGDEPEALLQELKSFCEERRCESVVNKSATGSFAVIDIVLVDAWVSNQELDQAPKWALEIEADSSYFERETPALEGFLNGQAALAVHWRADAMAERQALMNSQSVNPWAPEISKPRANSLYYRLGRSNLAMQLDSPEAREFEDHAVLVGTDAQGQFDIETLHSHTERGAQIQEAVFPDVRAPEVIVDNPALQFELAFDYAAAQEAAAKPDWMLPKQSDQEAMEKLDELLREIDSGERLIPSLNYPMGYLKGLGAAMENDAPSSLNPMQAVEGVVGVRGSIAWKEDAEPPLDIIPEGGVVLVVEPESRASMMLEQVVAEFDSNEELQAIELRADIVESGDHLFYRFGIGDLDQRFGDLRSLEHIDIKMELSEFHQLRTLLQESGPGGMRFQWMEMPVFDALDEEVALSRRTEPQGTGLHFRLGASDGESAEVPPGSVARMQPEVPSRCYRDVVAASRSGMVGRSFEVLAPSVRQSQGELEGLSEFADRMHEEIHRLRGECTDLDAGEAAELDWLIARWTTYRALVAASQFRHDDARRGIADACELGDPRACEISDDLAEWSARPPRVDASMLDLPGHAVGPFELSVAVVEPQGVQWTHFNPFNRHLPQSPISVTSIDGAEGVMGGFANLVQSYVVPTALGPPTGSNLLVLYADERVASKKIGALVALLKDDAVIERVGEFGSAGWDSSRNPQIYPWNDLRAVAIAVDSRKGVEADHLGTLVFSLRERDRSAGTSLELTISEGGVNVVVDGEAISPIGECADGRPTVCVEAPEIVRALMADASSDEADSAVIDALRASYPLTELADVVADAFVDTPDAVVIGADQTVPFGLVAEVAGGVWGALDFDEQDALYFHLDIDE